MNLLSGADIQCPLSVLEGVRIIEGFLMKIYGNFLGTLETVRNTEVSVLERFDCTAIQFLLIFFLSSFLGIGQTQSINKHFQRIFPFSRDIVTFVRTCPNPG